ncbi:Cobyrinate a,c-diamide synthase [Nymphon striatum]|nr:Cobyrinate a,c-diamide synthase [Nymphon striatum]
MTGGPRHEQKLRAITEEYTDIPVLGMVRKNRAMELDERHLGLMPSNEDQQANQKINDIAQIISDSVDLTRLVEISKIIFQGNTELEKKVRIGICEDAAFGFYYIDDKQALIKAGAELVSIDTLHDSQLPDNLDGLFIGGGFPETHMQQLADNQYNAKEYS